MGKRKKIISLVIPVYNEEEVIPELVKQLKSFMDNFIKYNFEVILVENGSYDSSFILLKKYANKDKRLKILQLSKNIGGDGGVSAGINYANGEALVIMMADLQEPLEMINKFIEKWEQGFEIVYGIVKKRTAGFWHNLEARLFYKVINFLTGNIFPENVADFRLLDKKVYRVINSMQEQNKYLRGLTIWTGFKQAGIPFDRLPRFAGKPKASFKVNFKTALNGILSFSYLPLHMVAILGLFITIISFCLIVYYLAHDLIYGREAPGIATIIISTLFLFGILFFVLGIISEYLVKIYDEVKRRPTFIIRDKINL